jgi:phosphatidylserine synthase
LARNGLQPVRFAVPDVLTAGRLILGGVALILALEGSSLALIATLIAFGSVVGGLGSLLAARLRATSPFGVLFESFADYLGAVIAPWVLTRILLGGSRTLFQELLLDLPLMTAAFRYARNGQLAPDLRALPGLDPVFFAFVSVTAVFLRLPELLSAAQLAVLLIPVVAVLSLLMLVPLRYPTLGAAPGVSLAVLVVLAMLPLVQTERLTMAVIVFGLLYCVLGHLVPVEP